VDGIAGISANAKSCIAAREENNNNGNKNNNKENTHEDTNPIWRIGRRPDVRAGSDRP
jgi:hypothetical protein